MKIKRISALIFVATLVLSVFFAGCSNPKVVSDEERSDVYENVEDISEVYAENSDNQIEENTSGLRVRQIKDAVLEDEIAVNLFTDEPFASGKINDDDDAMNALYEFLEDVGESTDLGFASAGVTRTNEGNVVYAFYQTSAEGKVEGAGVKLVTDSEGNAIGLNGTIRPEIKGNTDGEYVGADDDYDDSDDEILGIFDWLEPDTWTGTVTKYHGEKEEVTIPVGRDPENGDLYLADLERRIIAADYATLTFGGDYDFRKAKDGRFADNEILIYKAVIDVYDFYDGIGWTGCDGEGSPTLILMDWVYENGDPEENCAYDGIDGPFNVFKFNRVTPDGEAYDIVAHEFTHAVTSKNLLFTVGVCEYGAIDESMSDIMGNLVEGILGKTEDTTWLIGEKGEKPMRCMSSPHDFNQPAFIWDKDYMPMVKEPSGLNDVGGVHKNSSLLNLIAYRLNESGMNPYNQVNYWMNVSYMITPRTDFKQMSMLLPFALEIAGYEEYTDVLVDAIIETSIMDRTLPDTVPENLARFRLDFSNPDFLDKYNLFIIEINVDTKEVYADVPDAEFNVLASAVDPGRYYIQLEVTETETGDRTILEYSKDGWYVSDGLIDTEDLPEDFPEENITVIGNGEVIQLDTKELLEGFTD